jgi:hypothetical protein
VLPLTRKARFRLAGWACAGRASNPLDRYERFQLVLTFIPLSCSPDASGFQTRPGMAGANHEVTHDAAIRRANLKRRLSKQGGFETRPYKPPDFCAAS